MDIKYQEVLKQYDFKVQNTYRTRGAHIIETNEGDKLFKRLECSKNRVEFEYKTQQLLIKRGYSNIDLYVPNSNDEIITRDTAGNCFVIKNWNSGREIDLREEEEVLCGVVNLASIHMLLRNTPVDKEDPCYRVEENLHKIFDKRIRELRRVRSYIRGRRKKHEFELCFLDCYDNLFKQAIRASKLLKESQYSSLLEHAIANGHVCHGNYTYHNLKIIDKKSKKQDYRTSKKNYRTFDKEVITTNFDKAIIGVQIQDLYHLIRKTMEKNDWNASLGNKMIDTYDSICKISKEELKLLYVLLLYPEKFWKVSNYYYNGKKTWVPKRTIQKLMDVGNQDINKDIFLNQLKENIVCP